jgi:hypothetical protein
MKSHVFRPLWIVFGLICVILIARLFYVPKDFGVHERGYMYGWKRRQHKRLERLQDKNLAWSLQNCHPEKPEHSDDPARAIQCETATGLRSITL